MRIDDGLDIERKRLPIEFIAPHPLDKAAGILQRQHQDATIWAWKGQRRTVVKILQLDPYLYEYRVRRVPKSKLSGTFSNMEIKGYLKRLDDNSTLVVGEPHIPLIPMLLMSAGLILMFALIALLVMAPTEDDPRGKVFPIVFMFIIGPAMVANLYWEKWQLTTMLKNSLERY